MFYHWSGKNHEKPGGTLHQINFLSAWRNPLIHSFVSPCVTMETTKPPGALAHHQSERRQQLQGTFCGSFLGLKLGDHPLNLWQSYNLLMAKMMIWTDPKLFNHFSLVLDFLRQTLSFSCPLPEVFPGLKNGEVFQSLPSCPGGSPESQHGHPLGGQDCVQRRLLHHGVARVYGDALQRDGGGRNRAKVVVENGGVATGGAWAGSRISRKLASASWRPSLARYWGWLESPIAKTTS